jgi:Domain of unknown function (DUF4373)
MKDAYYFRHDANARHDPKLSALSAIHGMAGIGRFWCMVEILREQTNYQLNIENKFNRAALQRELQFPTLEEFNDFLADLLEIGLFVEHEGLITSLSLIKRMEHLETTRDKRASAGSKGGKARVENQIQANLKQTVKQIPSNLQANGQANLKQPSSKRSSKSQANGQANSKQSSSKSQAFIYLLIY